MPRKGQRPRRVTIIRYVDAATGERVRKGTPGAKKIKERSATYYAVIGGRKTSLGTADEAEAWNELNRLKRREHERRLGITDQYLEAADRAIEEHISEWLQSVQDGGATTAHCALLGARVAFLVQLAGWKRITEITARSCLSALAKLRTSDEGTPRSRRKPADSEAAPDPVGRSPQTRNHYLSAVKQHCRWLWTSGRLREHPLAGLKPVSIEADIRHARRCPTDDEVSKLMAWLETGEASTGRRKWSMDDRSAPFRVHMSGPQRALGYRVAMATGFRAGELRSLSRESFDLDGGTVSCRASYSKRKRKDTQHLPTWLVRELRTWFAAGGGCWSGFPERHPGRVLRYDLERSGVAYCMESLDGPQYFDFHSLRHWYVTWAANQPGISPKTLMQMARHSTAELTMRIYAKARQSAVKNQAEKIPDPRQIGLKKPGEPQP